MKRRQIIQSLTSLGLVTTFGVSCMETEKEFFARLPRKRFIFEIGASFPEMLRASGPGWYRTDLRPNQLFDARSQEWFIPVSDGSYQFVMQPSYGIHATRFSLPESSTCQMTFTAAHLSSIMFYLQMKAEPLDEIIQKAESTRLMLKALNFGVLVEGETTEEARLSFLNPENKEKGAVLGEWEIQPGKSTIDTHYMDLRLIRRTSYDKKINNVQDGSQLCILAFTIGSVPIRKMLEAAAKCAFTHKAFQHILVSQPLEGEYEVKDVQEYVRLLYETGLLNPAELKLKF